jgi:transcriptional regulator NrdR family protein
MCPECGGRQRRVRFTTYDSEGRKLRYGVCLTCGRRYSTVEVTIPDPHSVFTLSGLRKEQNRLAQRQRRGFHATGSGPRLKPEPILDVRVQVRSRH